MLAHAGPHALDLVIIATSVGITAVVTWFAAIRRRGN